MEFLATKHGLAAAMRNDPDGFTALHALLLCRLVPALADICAGGEPGDPHYDARLVPCDRGGRTERYRCETAELTAGNI
ncbi:hypothetical protein ACIRQQ_22275 [Streptomyces fuscichromogenes]|uniref:hypothetical protein n=1 Tax=Streptomyces fuscichromogenes TaxID=1324013 RepID=UPI00380B7166